MPDPSFQFPFHNLAFMGDLCITAIGYAIVEYDEEDLKWWISEIYIRRSDSSHYRLDQSCLPEVLEGRIAGRILLALTSNVDEITRGMLKEHKARQLSEEMA